VTGPPASSTPALEWISAAVGLAITLAMMAIIGREALAGDGQAPAAITVEARGVTAGRAGYVVEFEARNSAPAAAAAIEIEGVLTGAAPEPETSSATLDYVAGRSRHRGAMIFAADPATGRLSLRVRGYSEP